MLYKEIKFEQTLKNGDPGQQIIFNMEKTAGIALKKDTELLPDIREYIANLRPDKNKIYILAVAVAVAEYWGNNKNGDRFRYEELYPGDDIDNYGYKTLEHAKIYVEHNNKPNSPSIGQVLKAFMNHKMGRVEVIYYIDRNNALAKNIVQDIDQGILPDVSMGCKVAYDVCTICGKKARTPADRCEHIPRYLNKIFPDGRICGMDNIKPVFFDLSIVKNRAEQIAVSMMKVASSKSYRPILGNQKISAINKRVPMEYIISPGLSLWFPELMAGANTINSNHQIDLQTLLRQADPDSVLMTMLMLGVKPTPEEFCQIMKAKLGEDGIGDSFDYDMEPPPIEAVPAADLLIKDLLNADVMPDLLTDQDLAQRSTSPMFLIKRINEGNTQGLQGIYAQRIGDGVHSNGIIKGMYTILSNKLPDIVTKKAATMVPSITKIIAKKLILDKIKAGYLATAEMVKKLYDKSNTTEAINLTLLYWLLKDFLLGSKSMPPALPNADNFFNSHVQIMPAAINSLAYSNLTKTAANMLYYVGAPVVALAISNYLQRKALAGQPLTPTQAAIANHPNLAALTTLVAPHMLSKLDAKNNAILAASGLAGYAIGQGLSKLSAVREQDLEKELATINMHIKIASKLTLGLQKNTLYWLTPETEKALMSFLGGAGLGYIIGVRPSKSEIQQPNLGVLSNIANRRYSLPVVAGGRFIPHPHIPMGLGRSGLLTNIIQREPKGE